MRVMTFNTRHCESYVDKKIDFELIAKTIKACGADIVGLNEMKIDYLFVSGDIEVLSADIPPIVASDHRPHTATLRIPGI